MTSQTLLAERGSIRSLTLLAFLTVESLCAITRTVRFNMALSIASLTRCSLSESRALVACVKTNKQQVNCMFRSDLAKKKIRTLVGQFTFQLSLRRINEGWSDLSKEYDWLGECVEPWTGELGMKGGMNEFMDRWDGWMGIILPYGGVALVTG